MCDYSDQALRIKTKAAATDASVTNVTYSGNTATGTKKYGVIIDQVCPTVHRTRALANYIVTELPVDLGYTRQRRRPFCQSTLLASNTVTHIDCAWIGCQLCRLSEHYRRRLGRGTCGGQLRLIIVLRCVHPSY